MACYHLRSEFIGNMVTLPYICQNDLIMATVNTNTQNSHPIQEKLKIFQKVMKIRIGGHDFVFECITFDSKFLNNFTK